MDAKENTSVSELKKMIEGKIIELKRLNYFAVYHIKMKFDLKRRWIYYLLQ